MVWRLLQVLQTSCGVLQVIFSTLSTPRWSRTWRSHWIITSLPPRTTPTWQETSFCLSPGWKCTPMFSKQAVAVWRVSLQNRSFWLSVMSSYAIKWLTFSCFVMFCFVLFSPSSFAQWTAGMGLMESPLFTTATLWHPRSSLKMWSKQLTNTPSQNHRKSLRAIMLASCNCNKFI